MMKVALSAQGAAGANRLSGEKRGLTSEAPPGGPDGAAWDRALLAVLARPRPQQGVAFATLVVEQVGVDGRREGGVVELERKVVATFLGALRPGGTYLGPAHEDSVARSLVVGGVGFRDDADAFGLQTEGDDLALEIVADLLERTDGSHVTSPVCVSSPRPPRPRWRSSGRGRSATHPPSGPQRSGGRRRRDFLASRGMGVSPGEESLKRRRCGSDDRGAAGLRPDRAIKEATCVRVLNRNLGRRLGVSRFESARSRNDSA